MSDSSNNNVVDGPCGACKFLRRKCVRWCIFAPYFDQDQGIAHFEAVHRVFGASNAAKLLQSIPPHRRLDAVVTLCYEALARVRDPVYGCVGHIFTLQQQVIKLQAELAVVQASISMLQPALSLLATPLLGEVVSSLDDHCSSDFIINSTTQNDPFENSLLAEISTELVSFCDSIVQEMFEDGDLQSLAREYVSRYFPGVIFKPPASM